MEEYINKKSGNGFVTLISTLVVSAAALSISTSLLLLGLSASRKSFALAQSQQAKALANACIEEALQQIHDSVTFQRTGNLSLGQGVCAYTVTLGTGQNRTVTSTGTVGRVVRKVKVTLSAIRPAIAISFYQEIADF